MTLDIFPGARLRQLVEWGYPMGSLRPTPPASLAFSVIHITGNSRLPSADGEVSWRQSDPGLQNSATFFVNRDGSIVQALGDPLHMDPWSNGDVKSPDIRNPRIARVLRDGVNANERTVVAIENVGYEPGASLTPAQEKSCARIIAHYHAKAGVPVNRETVIGHYQLNSVSRSNCPAVDKRVIDRIVALAAPQLPKEDDDVPNAQPATWHPIAGSALLKGGQLYNAFQFRGMKDGAPVLERFNDITYGDSTGARVIARAHWEPGTAESASYLVSPFVWLPGVGVRDMVWWSKSPRPEPTVTLEAGGFTQAELDAAVAKATSAAVAKAVAALNARIDAAQRGG